VLGRDALILGAITNPVRYSHKAALKLSSYGHEIYCFGKQKGLIENFEIKNEMPHTEKFDPITL
jgi:hypothetical protein